MSIFNFFKKSEKQTVENEQEQPVAPEMQTSDSKTAEEAAQPAETRSLDSEMAKRVHNLIILDESGSMMSIYRPALSGVNETLQTIREAQKEHEGQEHYVTLVAFDTEHYDKIYSNTPAANTEDITENQYQPYGGTPLYDAMGRSINELSRNVANDDVVLVTIITDGYENSSCEYNGKAIKSLIETMKARGWVFTYIGANQDVEAVADSMSIDNRLAFKANASSTQEMFAQERRSRKKFYKCINDDILFEISKKCYFDEDDKDTKVSES